MKKLILLIIGCLKPHCLDIVWSDKVDKVGNPMITVITEDGIYSIVITKEK